MNERIRELALQAGIELADDSAYNSHIYRNSLERFARMIARECIQVLRDKTPVVDENDSVEDWDRGYIRAMVDCEYHIEEHFGIDE